MKEKIKYVFISLITLFIGIIPNEVNANTITLNKHDMLLGIGYDETLTVNLGNETTSSNILWLSSNEKVATVVNGKVHGVSYGETIITVSVNGKRDTCSVTVSDKYIPVKGISLNKSTVNLSIGTSETLTATINPNNATNKSLTWKSSDPSIATVENGKITAKKVGKTIITVTSFGYRATSEVNVVDTVALNGISLNKTTLTLKENDSETLKINYNPSNATNKKVTWKSSNSNIVKVDSYGKVTAIKPGTATITVISNENGYVATCKITVEAISKKVTNITLDKKELKLIVGENATLKETITPSYAENKKVTWESLDKTIATVEDGKVTAIAQGETEIKVISEDGKKEAICKVIVTLPPIKSITFSETEKTVYVESETKLLTVSEPANAILENPIWTSSDQTVATVENGIVTALNAGTTTITVSNGDGSIKTSIIINVVEKPKEKLQITVEGYEINFDPNVKVYDLTIGNEDKIIINTNVKEDNVIIKGNQNLENGSIITIEIKDDESQTYIINIKKKENYTIVFIAIISALLLLNLIRLFINNKKKK